MPAEHVPIQKTASDKFGDPNPLAIGRVVIPYAAVSALWILLSDALVSILFHDPTQIAIVSAVKGWVFITVTSALLVILLRRYGSQFVQREAVLRESEERWKFALEGAGEGVWDWNIQTGEAVYSRRWKEMIGYAESEIENDSSEWSNRVHPEDISGVMKIIQAHIDGKTPSAEVEFRMLCKDGSWKWVLGRGMVVRRSSDGKPLRLVGTNTDIADRKQTEAELMASKQAAENASLTKSRFLAAASHDLRQPIQAINLFQDALSKTPLNEEQKRISNYLSLSAQNLGGILNALLDISKLDAGTVKPHPVVIKSHALFRQIDSEFSPQAAAKSLRLKLYFPQREMSLFLDANLVRSLLANLIGNAIKYTERGCVLVGIRHRGKRAVIQVWDTGIGIAPEHMNSIFDEYFQVGNPERDRANGLGLGLAIARRLAKLQGTDVVCRSQPGKGSVFEFSLPFAGEEDLGHAQSETATMGAAHGLAGRTVILIEDDLMVTEATRWSLESIGMHVTAYGSAQDALASSDIANADFYIADLGLPGLNGNELLDAIQQRTPKPIKAVIVTGNTSPDQIAIAQSSRWKVLFKPIDLPTLLAAIKTLEIVH
jgi:PAS domain S-box-containing protein